MGGKVSKAPGLYAFIQLHIRGEDSNLFPTDVRRDQAVSVFFHADSLR